MELAMHLGMTAENLERSMSEREFRAWMLYAERRALPLKRLETYLAQLAFLIVKSLTTGGDRLTLSDFMLQDLKPKDESNEVTRAEAARKVFNFKPRNKGAPK